MSEHQQSDPDPLEEAIRAFQGMTVGERPPDEEVLARFGLLPSDVSQPPCVPVPSKRRYFMHLVVSAAAAAMLLFGGLALLLRNSPPPESVQVAANDSPDKGREVAVPPAPRGGGLLREGLGSFGDRVAEAQVIVVATGLDSSPAPARRPGDLPENLIRYQVTRVLKGELARKEITVRTPTAAAELVGKEWIIFLTPDYLAGKYPYASCLNSKFEPTVKSYLPKGQK